MFKTNLYFYMKKREQQLLHLNSSYRKFDLEKKIIHIALHFFYGMQDFAL